MKKYYRENADRLRAQVLKYREEHIEAVRAYDRRRGHRADPAKNKARSATRRALNSGQLTRQPCEVCGAESVEAHHDDYGKPLEVRWLCKQHHMLEHRSVA